MHQAIDDPAAVGVAHRDRHAPRLVVDHAEVGQGYVARVGDEDGLLVGLAPAFGPGQREAAEDRAVGVVDADDGLRRVGLDDRPRAGEAAAGSGDAQGVVDFVDPGRDLDDRAGFEVQQLLERGALVGEGGGRQG